MAARETKKQYSVNIIKFHQSQLEDRGFESRVTNGGVITQDP